MPSSRGLYAISQTTHDTSALLAWADAVIDGGARWLQYRDKGCDDRLRLEQAVALAALCRTRDVRFLVNDDIELAKACEADGVHLGEDDAGLPEARTLLGSRATIGVSCYDDLQRAIERVAAGADYLAFGAFFASGTKPGARRATPNLLVAARRLERPLVAIGGITPDNGDELVRAGADLLAVIGGLDGAPGQARAMARRYTALFTPFPSDDS